MPTYKSYKSAKSAPSDTLRVIEDLKGRNASGDFKQKVAALQRRIKYPQTIFGGTQDDFDELTGIRDKNEYDFTKLTEAREALRKYAIEWNKGFYGKETPDKGPVWDAVHNPTLNPIKVYPETFGKGSKNKRLLELIANVNSEARKFTDFYSERSRKKLDEIGGNPNAVKKSIVIDTNGEAPSEIDSRKPYSVIKHDISKLSIPQNALAATSRALKRKMGIHDFGPDTIIPLSDINTYALSKNEFLRNGSATGIMFGPLGNKNFKAKEDFKDEDFAGKEKFVYGTDKYGRFVIGNYDDMPAESRLVSDSYENRNTVFTPENFNAQDMFEQGKYGSYLNGPKLVVTDKDYKNPTFIYQHSKSRAITELQKYLNQNKSMRMITVDNGRFENWQTAAPGKRISDLDVSDYRDNTIAKEGGGSAILSGDLIRKKSARASLAATKMKSK